MSEEYNIDSIAGCDEDVFVLSAPEEQGIELSYSCRTGACSTCVGKIEDGEITQSKQIFLDEDQIEIGFVLPRIAYLKSNCTIRVHYKDELY